MDKKLKDSKKFQIDAGAAAVLLSMVKIFSLDPRIAAAGIIVIAIANILGQAWQDGKKAEKKDG